MLRSLGARASRPQIGAADPTQRLGFIFRCVFESRNREMTGIPRKNLFYGAIPNLISS